MRNFLANCLKKPTKSVVFDNFPSINDKRIVFFLQRVVDLIKFRYANRQIKGKTLLRNDPNLNV